MYIYIKIIIFTLKGLIKIWMIKTTYITAEKYKSYSIRDLPDGFTVIALLISLFGSKRPTLRSKVKHL